VLEFADLHPLFAAEVKGLDLAGDLDDRTFARIGGAFARRSVLVFRNQDIDDDQQIAFSARFGPLEATKVDTPGAGSKIVILTNVDGEGNLLAPTDRQILNGRANQFWHTDSSFKEMAAAASMLSARQIPPTGGNTEFISMRAVYAALPERLKDAVAGRVAIHDYAHGRTKVDPRLATEAERATLPPVRQAMVLDHGGLGKSLYIGAHTAAIEGMAEAPSRELIDELTAFATQEQFIYSHAWRPHDLVLWDNRATMHRGTAYDRTAHRRTMVRTTIAGTVSTLAVTSIML